MKKSFKNFSVVFLTVFLVCVSVLCFTSFAAEVSPASWDELSQALSVDGNYIKLSQDIKTDKEDNALHIPENVSVTLDLNGYTIDRGMQSVTGSWEENNVIDLKGTLTLNDSNPTAENTVGDCSITGGNITGWGGGVYIWASGTLIMNSGNISGNKAVNVPNGVYGNGGGVFIAGGKFIMNGGSVDNNTAENGGGVFVNSYKNKEGVQSVGEFTMNGGTIKNNKAVAKGSRGGAVEAYNSIFTMNGGVIENNYSNSYGGAVFLVGCKFTMNDGIIKGNTSKAGSGVYVGCETTNLISEFIMNGGSVINNYSSESYGGIAFDSGALFSVGGKSVIKDNTDKSGISNVCLIENSFISLNNENPLKEGAYIGVNTPNNAVDDVIVAENAVAESKKYFHHDSGKLNVNHKLNMLVLGNQCTVSFVLNGHGKDIKSFEIEKNEIVGDILEPIEKGYRFDGWYTGADLQRKWNLKTDKVTEDITLYAKWVELDWVQNADGTWMYFQNGQALTSWQNNTKNYEGKWFFFDNNGIMKTGWLQENGIWYYLKENGIMATGWIKINGAWYCFASNGAMYANTYTPDGYYVNSDGVWVA